MTESYSLQVLIIEQAGELFREQGYAATTIKQIAKAAGCTTAALYYYFEDGKQHILREVIRQSARKAEDSMPLPQAGSLEEFLVRLGAHLAQRWPGVADRFNWIMLQFATLPDEEKRIVQNQLLGIQRALKEQIGQYVADTDSPSPAIRSRCPLRTASITVEDVPGDAGWYRVKMQVRPHFKYMGASFTLGLVGKLDKE